MIFEIWVLVFQIFLLLISTLCFGTRASFFAFSLLAYGPAMSLFKLGPIPAGSMLAVAGIFLLLFGKSSKNSLFFLVCAYAAAFLSCAGNFSMDILFSTFHFLIYATFGVLLGSHVCGWSDTSKRGFLRSVIFIGSFSLFFVLIGRQSQTIVRDVGFGLMPIFIFLCAWISAGFQRYAGILASLLYIFGNQTRSTAVELLIAYFSGSTRHGLPSGQRSSKRSIMKRVLGISSVLILAISTSLIFYLRAGTGGADGILSVGTRINAVLLEYETFMSSPIFGAGVSYFHNDALSLIEDNVTDEELYIAYNHIGVVSVFAQAGVLGGIVFLLVPIAVYQKVNGVRHERPPLLAILVSIMLLVYFISFFVAGSPIRRDFSDGVFYYFCIGFLLRYLGQRKGLSF